MTPDLSKLSDAELEALIAASQATPTGPQPTTVRELDVIAPNTNAPMQSAGADVGALSDQQLRALAAQYDNARPDMSMLEDVGRSVVTGLQHGAGAVVGLPGDITNLTGQGVDWLNQKLISGLEGMGIANPGAAEQFNRQAPKSPLPTSETINRAVDSVTGPAHVPQTTPGRYAGAIAGMAPGAALGPGGLLTKAALAVVPGVLSEGAADLAPGDQYDTGARLAGAITGGLGVGGVSALTASPQRLLADALGPNVTQQEIQRAGDLMRAGMNRGVQLTPAEAVQQVTNGATGLGRMQRVVEGTREGQQQLSPLFAQRPQQVRDAALSYADTIAPPNPQPSMIGTRAQEAAQGGLDRVRQGINQAAEADYAALAAQTMPEAEYAALSQNPSFQAALRDLRGNPELNGPIASLPDNNLSVVNEVVKRLDRNQQAAAQTAMNPGGDNQLAALRGQARTLADEAAAAASPEWANARQTVAQGRERFLNPLEAGATGRIASTSDVPTQTGALFPANPLEGASNETVQALRAMGMSDPTVAPDLTRQHLVNALNTASTDLIGGQNQYLGAKYAKSIAGNPEQANVLQAGVTEVAGQPAADELAQLVEVLRATGKRQPPGSLTAFNQDDLSKFGIASIGNSKNPLKMIGEGVSAIQYRRNVNKLAEALQLPADEAQALLEQVSRARGRAPGNAALAGALISSGALSDR